MSKSMSEDATTIAVSYTLRHMRLDSGKTWDQLGDETGIDKRTLQRYFTGERDIRLGDFVKICDAFKVKPNDVWTKALPAGSSDQERHKAVRGGTAS